MQKDIDGKCINEDILLNENERRRIIYVIDPTKFIMVHLSYPKHLLIKSLVVVVLVY